MKQFLNNVVKKFINDMLGKRQKKFEHLNMMQAHKAGTTAILARKLLDFPHLFVRDISSEIIIAATK